LPEKKSLNCGTDIDEACKIKHPFDPSLDDFIFSDGMLASSSVSNLPNIILGRISLDTLLEQQKANQKFYIVDFSKNALDDDDIPLIRNFVIEKKTSIQILNLSCNRLSCSNGYLINDMWDIIENVLQYVVIYGNQMSTFDCKDFFLHMNMQRASKLIWITRFHLDGYAWKNLLPSGDQEIYKIVLNTHKEYYELLE
jgi:hypothetical protein